MALLRVSGQLDVNQFWPAGDSDADTVVLQVSNTAFEVQQVPGGAFTRTNAFAGAWVRGRQGQKQEVIKNNKIRIRLQGIDAPELHYNATPAKKTALLTAAQQSAFKALNKKYRQKQGETATVAFRQFVVQAGNGNVSCQFVTQADAPNDVPDIFGRLVGDVVIKVGGQSVNLNAWLLENGWAFPAFYNSMTNAEIATLTAKAETARKNNLGIWPHFTQKVGTFNFNVQFRKAGSALDPTADKGKVIFPKLFRRQTNWAVNKKAAIITDSFRKSLQATPDNCHIASDFLQNGPLSATVYKLHEFLGNNNTFQLWPHQVIFRESAATLRDANGNAVLNW